MVKHEQEQDAAIFYIDQDNTGRSRRKIMKYSFKLRPKPSLFTMLRYAAPVCPDIFFVAILQMPLHTDTNAI